MTDRGGIAARAEIVFVVQATTTSQLRAAFPSPDDEVAPSGLQLCRRSSLHPGRHEVLSAPEPTCAQTVAAVGWSPPRIVPDLRDLAPGEWQGRELTSLSPDQFRRWRAGEAPPGGESLADLCERIRDFVDGVGGGRYVAVVSQAVARAAVVAALGLPVASVWNVDAEPLSTIAVARRADGELRLRLITGTGPR